MVNLWLEDVAGLPHHNDWRVIASPGHTPESLCLYNAFTKELLCGDTLITLERGNPILRGGTSGSNRRQLEETLRLLRNLDVLYLYPGHGRPILAKIHYIRCLCLFERSGQHSSLQATVGTAYAH